MNDKPKKREYEPPRLMPLGVDGTAAGQISCNNGGSARVGSSISVEIGPGRSCRTGA